MPYSLENFKKNLSKAKIVHISSHSFTKQNADEAFIAFSKVDTSVNNEGNLHLYEIYNLYSNADLVFLASLKDMSSFSL